MTSPAVIAAFLAERQCILDDIVSGNGDVCDRCALDRIDDDILAAIAEKHGVCLGEDYYGPVAH